MSDLTNEELLEFLKKAEEENKKGNIKKVKSKDSSSVKRFIKDNNIETGLDKIPTYVIFYTYKRKWSDNIYKEKKVNKIVFFRAFNKLFTQIRTGKQRYYLLDKKSFDLTREGLLEAKYFEESYNAKK